jgi:hypothetical protein
MHGFNYRITLKVSSDLCRCRLKEFIILYPKVFIDSGRLTDFFTPKVSSGPGCKL